MAQRIISIKTPLGGEKLLVRSATLTEQLGKPFEIDIDLLSVDERIDFDQLLGKEVTLTVLTKDNSPRYFHAWIAGFAQLGRFGRHELYRARAVPWLWFLGRTADCCIFQNKTVPDILREVFSKYGFTDFKDNKLTRSYRQREYCVQYRESSLNFVQRLMEEEGIYYYFEHSASQHMLVLADSYSAHQPCAGYASIDFLPRADNVERYEDCIHDWELVRTIQSGKYVVTDYDFTKPRDSLQTQFVQSRQVPKSDFEVFDYPGKYAQIPEGDHYARVRLESLQAGYETVKGAGNARGLAVGSLFKLKGYPRADQNREYLLVSATHKVDAGDYETGGAENDEPYTCTFEAIDAKEPYRPNPSAMKALVNGPQTAVVVGPAGEEIWTDPYARVKVKFHWDRSPNRDETSSCWVRVSQTWAGKGWGSVVIPRIGQEVIVEFLEGDPDQPMITGCVYNQTNMPPYGLPGSGVVSGLKSQTHKGSGFNEISMDDTTGKEKMTVHAQYDLGTTVQHDETHTVVSGNRTMAVQTGTNTETIKGNSSLTVQAGARTVDVTGGDYSATSSAAVKLHGKSAGVSITGNSEGVTVMGDGKGVSITGTGEGVFIKGTGNGVTLDGAGFVYLHGADEASLHSPVVNIGDKEVNVAGTKVVLSAGGGSITIDATGVTIMGTIVKIN